MLGCGLSIAQVAVRGIRGAPAPAEAITAPTLATSSTALPGDINPRYVLDFVDPSPTGGGIDDTLVGQWGTSQAGAEAMTPEEVLIEESWFIDGTPPFPNLNTFAAAQAQGTTIHFRVKVKRGAQESAWSNWWTWLLEDGTMTAPARTDLTGQAQGIRVWSAPFTVAGLGAGCWARLEGTGPIRVGGSAVTEAGGEVLVQNGASVEFGADTAAAIGATTDNVVTNRGTVIDTFSATTAGTAPLPQWSSVALFVRADDTASMFQSNAGTGAITADGQPVGNWRDLSANGFHLTSAADDTTRPTYRTAGGLHWVEFDGVNDLLRRLDAINLWDTVGYTLMIAVQGTANAANRYLVAEGHDPDNSTIFGAVGSQSTTATSSAHLYRSQSPATTVLTNGSVTSTNAFSGDKVLTVIDDGASVIDYVDGVAGTSRAYTRGTNAFTMNRFALGALLRATPGSFFSARVYALAIWPGIVLDSTDRATVRTLFGSLQGRSI